MSASVRELFLELVDVPRDKREKLLAERHIAADLCSEVESLLSYDSTPGESFTRRVSDIAEEALVWGHGSLPRQCGPYRLVQLLGSGGMSAVYLGERRDGEIEQRVAIKFLRADADRPAWRDRFLKERQFLAYLNHSSIARLLDAGHTTDGRPYLVMEYVDGVAIDEYAAPLDLRSQLRLFLLVCDGVSHAHRHLIVHRDLKPSNILVDSSGHPKLLDFGIAKPLDMAMDETQTVERLLTPNYASPEQLRGDIQTTATDVYSLGAVLHKLLTGLSPRERVSDASLEKPDIPRDIDYILRKALRQEPFERYASVDAFADDIRAFLESRPVQARSGDAWYRTRKFLRRYREAVAVAVMIAASILAGLYIAAQQRDIAQRRFLQVRHLANKVLALDEVVGGLHSSTKARHEIVAMSQEYLEALGAEAHKDQGLALEIGKAYSLLARAQGISVVANLGQHAQAEESLRKAEIFVEPVLSANPNDRKALLTAARISHDRMILTEIDRRNEEAVAQARKTVQYLDRLLALGELSEGETQTISEFFYHIALAHKNLHLPDDAIRYAHRSIEISRLLPNAQLRVSLGLSMLADLLRITGDLEAALQAIREARIHLEKVQFPSETARRSSWAAVFGREGKILGATSGLSLGRTSEAIVAHQKAFNLVEEWTQNDLQDAWSRLMFASVGRELGDVLRLRDPKRALAVYDHALLRLREVKNNTEARRGEVEILAGSAYALRRLHRVDEAKERIDTAFRLLRETKEYPADRVVPHESAEAALRALADHLAETDQPGRAAEVYEGLLAKLMVSKMDPWNDLRHAVLLSHIYGSLATLHRRTGRRNREEEFSSLRLELWVHWGRKLSNSSFVRRQLESARYPFRASRLPLHNRS